VVRKATASQSEVLVLLPQWSQT